jgi:hypothetical protein
MLAGSSLADTGSSAAPSLTFTSAVCENSATRKRLAMHRSYCHQLKIAFAFGASKEPRLHRSHLRPSNYRQYRGEISSPSRHRVQRSSSMIPVKIWGAVAMGRCAAIRGSVSAVWKSSERGNAVGSVTVCRKGQTF